MKWKKESKVYMWAHYHSEDGRWVAWDEDVPHKSNRREYNPTTGKFEKKTVLRHVWYLKNKDTDEVTEHKTLKAAKAYAEEH